MMKLWKKNAAFRFGFRLILFALGFSYALHQHNSSKSAFDEEPSGNAPEVAVFWQGHCPSADPGVRLFKDFSGFLPPDFTRFPFVSNLQKASIDYFPADPELIFLRFLRTSISINAP